MPTELLFARIMFNYATARAHTVKARTNGQRGASAIEWAVIAAIVVTAAIAMTTEIEKGGG